MMKNMNHKTSAVSKAFAAPISAEEMQRMPGRENRKKRTRAGKIFDLGRGLHQAVLFADPVHYHSKATGQWEEIDNTLIPVTDAAGGVYLTNRANDELNVEFHSTRDVATVLMQDDNDRLLAWRLEGTQDVAPVRVGRPCREHDACDLRRDVLAHLEDEAIYRNIFPGVDLLGRVQALSFKDELIFSTKESVRPVTFVLAAPDLAPEQAENGDIEFIAPTGETAYVLPAPFMKDSTPENIHGAVRCELIPSGEAGIWHMTYTPDEAWLANAQFPVTLDPAVISKKHSSAIEDNFITSAKPSTVQPYAGTGMTISNSSTNWGTSKAFVKFLDSGLPLIDSSYYVTKAYFSVMTKSAPTTAASILLKEVLGSWSSQTITYNNAPALSDKALDYQYMSANSIWYTYDISNLVRKWYGGTNYGLALEAGSRTYFELYTTDSPHMGTRCVKATVVDGFRCDMQQWVTLERGKTYTASYYAKCTGSMRVWLETYTSDEGWTVFEKPPVQAVSAYQRYQNSFIVPGTSGTCSVYIGIRIGSGNGTAWVDNVQLEEGPVANRYNMLINGDFTFNSGAHPTGWSKNSSNDASDIVYTTCTGTKPEGMPEWKN